MSIQTHDQLREAWTSFFVERGHTAYPSASLIPENDPTLLFTGAGMNQFKDMFLGKGNLPFTRASTIQKCFRQGDLDNVGRTPRHLTLFEMMGHFSFGDYFKESAIPWAWEFLTTVLELPRERLFVTVFTDDDEAYAHWRKVGVPESRLFRFDAAENFWPADAPKKGPNGPCGPCSEVFFDYGEKFAVGDASDNALDSGQYVEIWNSVFTQFNRVGVEQLEPLAQRNIDCGAGLERMLAAVERQISPFGTSLFRPIVTAVAERAGKPYVFQEDGGQPDDEDSRRIRRISEHARASCMLIADGVKPSNEGRGYVLRRVLRRAIRDGIQLGVDDTFLQDLVDPVLGVMGDAYPHLREGREVLRATLDGEDQRFRQTYRGGLRFLDEALDKLSGKTLPGDVAFKLYDTYGFPLDLAELILEEKGIGVDHAGFETAMEAQRERARAGSKMKGDIFAGGPLTELKSGGAKPTVFAGHENPGTEGQAKVLGVIADGALVAEAGPKTDVQVVLDQTPFYAEAGGQVGDRGVLLADWVRVQIHDTQKQEGFHIHTGTVLEGTLAKDAEVTARVDSAARDATRRNHTATHLMHKALKDVLGDHVRQEGSLVDPDKLRFDFSHPQALTDDEIAQIEDSVNTWIVANDEVATDVMDLDTAKASGAVALFGEKYDAKVRVVHVESGSRELCGGTHCWRTGDIGSFRITLETSIAAGVRRVEAVTGEGAVVVARDEGHIVRDLGVLLKAKPNEIVDRIQALQKELRDVKKAQEKAQREAGVQAAGALVDSAKELGGLRVQVAALPGVDAKALKGVWDVLKKGGVSAALLVGEANGKAPLLAAANDEATAAGIDARELLEAATSVLGGGGGGRPVMAQGMGQNAAKVAEAVAAAWTAFESAIG